MFRRSGPVDQLLAQNCHLLPDRVPAGPRVITPANPTQPGVDHQLDQPFRHELTAQQPADVCSRSSSVGIKSIGPSRLPLTMQTQVLFALRALRMFGFGTVGVILAVNLHQLGFSDQRIGIMLTLTLLGDALISLAITLFADRAGKWRMQLLGSTLLLLAGAAFANPWSQSFWLLTLAATIGVVSPSGNEVGPFQVNGDHIFIKFKHPAESHS